MLRAPLRIALSTGTTDGLRQCARLRPAYALTVEEVRGTRRWVALPILGGVLIGLTAVACSLAAEASPGLAAGVLIVVLGLVVVVWLMGTRSPKQNGP